VERLILRAPLSSNRIQLINEDNRRSRLPRRRKQLPNPPRTNSDVHLVELGTGGGEEGNAGFACDSASEEGLTRSRGASEENTTRETTTEFLVLRGVLEEVNNFVELVLGFFDTVNVCKSRATTVRIGSVGRSSCGEGSGLGAGAEDAGRVD
jgi:hypothetical protein